MSVLKKIIKKDPNQIADDDHPNRPDISEEEFKEALKEIAEKYDQHKPKNKKLVEHSEKMGQGTIDALNKL